MKHMSRVASRSLVWALLATVVGSAFADVPLASSDADRRAKQAVPQTGKALLYVYRKQDGDDTISALTLNGKEVARLEPQTFGLWNVDAGRMEIRADGKTLALEGEAGRIYFVEVTRSTAGGVALRQVSYATGRTQTHQARLVGAASATSDKAPAKKSAPASKTSTSSTPSA